MDLPEDLLAPLGAAIVEVREQRRLSVGTVADRAGMSAEKLSEIEAGQSEPTWGDLRRITAGLEVPLPGLMAHVEACEGSAG